MKIQSVADIITNSSSEVFVIQSDKTWEELEGIMDSWNLDDDWSGMGGCLDVYDNKRPYVGKVSNPDEPWAKWCPEGHLVIHIDWKMNRHIDKIFEEFNVVDSDTCNLVRDKKSGKTRRFNYDEKSLQENEEFLPAEFAIINKAKKELAEKEKKEAEDEMNSIADMETAKKFFNLYKKYGEALYAIDVTKDNQEDLEEFYEDRNKELHGQA